MANKTRRDAVWSYVLSMTYRQEKSITSEQVAEAANVSERTARDTLHVMENDYFIQRRRKDGQVVYQRPSEGL